MRKLDFPQNYNMHFSLFLQSSCVVFVADSVHPILYSLYEKQQQGESTKLSFCALRKDIQTGLGQHEAE